MMELISLRKRRLQCCRQLADTAEEQQSILLEGRHTDLVENLARFDSTLLELARLDKQEEQLLHHIGQYGDTGPPADISSSLSAIAEDTRGCLQRLQELSEGNTQLLRNAMQFMDFSIGVICRAAAGTDKSGQSAGSGSPAVLLDMKV